MGPRARLSQPPPLPPFQRERWSSPLRGPWLASFLSVFLAVLFAIELVTGYLSHAAYQAGLPANSVFEPGPDQVLYGWGWPTSPAWLYSFTQGLHVLAGLALVPILAAKLWTVMPKFYKWPPARSPAEVVERGTLGLLMASALFLLVTGVLNIAYWYPFGFSFVPAHYYAAWMFAGAFVGHVAIKLPVVVRAFRERGVLRPLRDDLAATRPEPPQADTSAPVAPGPTTVSRRLWLGLVGAGSLGMVVLGGGASWGGLWRALSPLSPRSQTPPGGPGDFPVNKTARSAGITTETTGPRWRLAVKGPRELELTRDQLLAMPLSTQRLPIACVEGWSTFQTWTGVPLRELARIAGVDGAATAFVLSIQKGSAFSNVTLSPGQVADPRSLLALRVNGTDLSLDHGYPARVIVPALPGVHNTKWVRLVRFEAA